MVIKFINSKELLENLILVINSKILSNVIKKLNITWVSCDCLHKDTNKLMNELAQSTEIAEFKTLHNRLSQPPR